MMYGYQPSVELASVAVGIFAVLTLLHVVRMVTTNTWDDIFLIFGGVVELVGYIFRLSSAVSSCSTATFSAFGIQSVLLLLGPTLLMFTVGLVQPRFIAVLGGDRFVWVPIRLQRPLYLGINTVLLIVQATGAIMEVSTHDMALVEAGAKIIIASYVMQMFFWGFLLAENTCFTIRMRKAKKNPAFKGWKWWNQLFGLSVAIIGFGRNLMRLTAFGVQFLLVNEWTSYAFDGYQMGVVMVAWGVFYLPGKVKSQSTLTNSTPGAEDWEMGTAGYRIRSEESVGSRAALHR